jgi:hypothetical protein
MRRYIGQVLAYIGVALIDTLLSTQMMPRIPHVASKTPEKNLWMGSKRKK